jgi:SAM-dependent methyltransferase
VFCVDREWDRVATLPERLGSQLHVAGQVEALPYLAGSFDVVTASQTLHRFAPGLALFEIARVLRTDGHFAVAYNTREDTVPWVRRLTALMKAADPTSMSGDYGADSISAVAESPYFHEPEQRTFRSWVPISRSGLVAMVERRARAAGLEPDILRALLDDVGQLYDTSARPPEPLLLPFRATCWRAAVDHRGLAAGAPDDDVLEIKV